MATSEIRRQFAGYRVLVCGRLLEPIFFNEDSAVGFLEDLMCGAAQ